LPDDQKKASLEAEVELIVEECRMVLPGIQALFGFQLIAVFNPTFSERLPPSGRGLHLAAIVLITVAIALIMAPAAYHRQAERDQVSQYFANYASGLLTIAMVPLLLAIASEVTLVAYVITEVLWASVGLGVLLALVFSGLWFVFPRLRYRHRAAYARGRESPRRD
jgi:membrane protein YdbS with pleckstrin-like domain